jgi:tRNA(fMet)-specific endonuclease VapC
MSFLLDTNICSAHMKGNRLVWQKMMQHGGGLHISTITLGELFTWVSRKGVSVTRREELREFLRDVIILDVTAPIGEKFGELRASLIDRGQGTPEMDLLIAATALVHGLTVVTHNMHDFADIPGLRVQDWLAP